MDLYFKRSNGEKILLLPGASSFKEVFDNIDDFLKDHNFKCYYKRVMPEEGKDSVWIDVGSHSEFFIIRDTNWEEYKKYMGIKDSTEQN